MLQTASQRRAFGWVLLIGGSVGLVVCLVSGIVGFVALGSARRASVKGLDVTQEALASVRSTLELADDLVGSVQEGMLVVEDTLGQVASTVEHGRRRAGPGRQRWPARCPARSTRARSTLRSLGSVPR